MAQEHFPDTAAEAATIKANEGFRHFVGDGTSVLRTPGLKTLQAVRIGGEDAPIKLVEPTLTSLVEGAAPEPVEHLMFAHREDEIGPYVVRSMKSNDGIWQKDAVFLIKGKFEDPKPAGTEGA